MLFAIVGLFLTFAVGSSRGQSICGKGFTCLPYSECTLEDEFLVVYPCGDAPGQTSSNKICCPESNIIVPSRLAALPEKCGDILNDDRITGGERAFIGQFPWMALLGYQQAGLPFTQYLCGGSLITDRFVLTAAHCLDLNDALKIVSVRLGELDLTTEKDCDKYGEEEECADPPVDVPVDKTFSHKMYDKDTLKNDIALVRTTKKIDFTDFIRPLCLPFGKFFQPRTYAEEKFTVSGWGKTQSAKIGGSNDLRHAIVTAWDRGKCNASVPPNVRPIDDVQICANGAKSEDACKGDSGGPLFNMTSVNGKFRTYQIGIVSFSSALICGNPELPTVYTRVDKYLDWIVDNVIHS